MKPIKPPRYDSMLDVNGENQNEDERSGWSSRRDSQISEDDADLIPKLSPDL